MVLARNGNYEIVSSLITMAIVYNDYSLENQEDETQNNLASLMPGMVGEKSLKKGQTKSKSLYARRCYKTRPLRI